MMNRVAKWMVSVAAVGCLLTGFALVGAQPRAKNEGKEVHSVGPRLGESGDPEYKGGPRFVAPNKGVRAFLGGGYGSHYLNGETGKALYTLPGHDYAEEFELAWEQTTTNYFYYYEKDYKDYKWRFSRWNAGNNNYRVDHTRPEDGWRHWRTVHFALLSDLPETTTLKTSREKK